MSPRASIEMATPDTDYDGADDDTRVAYRLSTLPIFRATGGIVAMCSARSFGLQPLEVNT
jgi:hypothetical protein